MWIDSEKTSYLAQDYSIYFGNTKGKNYGSVLREVLNRKIADIVEVNIRIVQKYPSQRSAM